MPDHATDDVWTNADTMGFAMEYHRAGYSCIPIGKDKVPAVPAGHPVIRRERRPTEAELRWWIMDEGSGIGILGGPISGGLEFLDIEERADLTPIVDRAAGICGRQIIDKLCVVRTPGGGYHLWYKIEGTSRNQVLARHADGTVRVETRAEGGYVVAPGSPPHCHPSGGRYEHDDGPPLFSLVKLTRAERDALLNAARALDQTPPPAPKPVKKPTADRGPGEISPLDDYTLRGPPTEELLEAAGWEKVRAKGTGSRWAYPGQVRPGWSASLGESHGADGTPLFRVYSTSAGIPVGSYSKGRLYAFLRHGGDLSAAAKDLAAQGYGSPPRKPGPVTAATPPVNPDKTPDTVMTRSAAPESKVEFAPPIPFSRYRDLGERVRWVWPGHIQEGVFNLLASGEGVGKTRLVADLIRRVQRGLPWPDGSPMTLPPDSAFIWLPSDDNHNEIVEFEQQMGLDISRVFDSAEEEYQDSLLEMAEDRLRLEANIRAVRPALVIVDTIMSSTERNINRAEEAAALFRPLSHLAKLTGTTILGLHHLNATGGTLGRRADGLCRVVMKLDWPRRDEPGDDGRRCLRVSKSNSKYPPPLGVTMHDWGNEYDSEPPTAAGQPPHGNKRAAAARLLRSLLAAGPARLSELRKAAQDAGISAATLYRAAEDIGVTMSDTPDGCWWSLVHEN